ncbi:ABC transporter ATP-binding protein [Micromonospora peucetia]|uniref:ABC transporter ATP-binding protein n=1 Tax=Micromonospora peucetia TaxID=47871 RepID=UPI0022516081|nr:ABC transporter ATP-binding protein [Micromonospora peucetia]MCX4385759.1 ABC transporter ATP-binding protein [Micromonospora peucetia]
MTEPVLTVEEVSKTYPTDPPTHALRAANLAVRAGELVAVVGPSGSGKSTLLSIMGTLEDPTSGTVRLRGYPVARLGDAQRAALRARHIGFVFQQFHLIPTLTAEKNVATGLLYTGAGHAERLRQARDALEAVGLAHRTRYRPGQLSGGEKQRVAIARALVKQPSIVFADEPTGALDTATGENIIRLLSEIARSGTAVIVITHDHAIADTMPRRVRLRDGRVTTDTGAPTA